MKIQFLLLGMLLLSALTVSAVQNTESSESVSVYVEKGWNLMYGLYDPNEQSLSGIQTNDIKIIYAYIPPLKQYVEVYPNPELTKLRIIDDDELLNMAFWVYSDRSGSVRYTIDEPSYIPWDERELYRGWNFVGLTSEIKMKELGGIRGTCQIEKMAFWQHQEWGIINPTILSQSDHPDLPSTWYELIIADSDSDIGRGALVKVTRGCKLGLSEAIMPPPQIPN